MVLGLVDLVELFDMMRRKYKEMVQLKKVLLEVEGRDMRLDMRPQASMLM